MTEGELETYLHSHIPLSRAMAMRVVSLADNTVVLGAPLAPNINHHDTVFGGSASALAILSAWSLVHLRLAADTQPARVVIQRNSMDYLRPITGEFTAHAFWRPDTDWDGFVRLLARRGLARITAHSELRDQAGKVSGLLSGDFVAFGSNR